MAQTVEVLLRPAVELYTVAVCAGSALLCLAAPWALALNSEIGLGSALVFIGFGTIRLRQAWVILRYRRNIRRLPRYALHDNQIPVSQERLFLGRGFCWEPHHTHRLLQTYRPEFRQYVETPWRLRCARHLEQRLEFAPHPLSYLARLTAWDHPLNPVRPLPAVGGLPRLHGVEPHEVEVSLPTETHAAYPMGLSADLGVDKTGGFN